MTLDLALSDPSLLREECLIGGDWITADDGTVRTVADPATGEAVGTVPNLGAGETARAIAAAEAALPAWRSLLAKERSNLLRRWFDLIIEHQEDVAKILTAEQGKPLREARAEVVSGAAFIEWFAEEARRAYGDVIPSPAHDRRIIVIKQPVGVCAAITPWNFPNTIITRKAGAALAAGCTMIVRPASNTPFSALVLGELAQRAGIPAGVLNVITGDARAMGAELTSSPLVRKLSFTGSTHTGSTLMAQSAGTVKKLALELGGNAPFIVFDDADIDAAVEGALASKFRNVGQACVGANRFYVHDAVYDEFASKLVERVRKLRVGPGIDPETTVGPLIDVAAVQKVESHIADAVKKGAKVAIGGRRHALGRSFFEPTVLTEVPADAELATDETFGPLAPLFRFNSEGELIAAANNTEYGLASYVYSRDIGRVWRVAEALETGMVGVNVGLMASEVVPFGGIKQSGFGREGSSYGLEDYLDVKYICMGGL
ncbi:MULTISPECIES: NAD-dependent succinate-semialdehyde dehydrogenase [unclassified Microbacterium]|uniref:NAD-dependent succinate-semialdehyde dehydrogenase n=1 Tax=unclassified Microbacterium TaxID=2609290 RepID=UPI00214C792E|nr:MULTISPECIES: NAD-dependent succinate-semialdehyde dehydrogenase [unclassified Microbacterium]MCR2811384.1 NAD-dependent succinate-semialdehyde dehydrogenase [Microbacterium sp. zg.B185]WIM19570.1 NAD-dependent succinate-semialdehyde dehydrogenase [Microbacterium sp. zg-B185]